MFSKIIEGDKFKSPFTGRVFKIKKIYSNAALLEDVEDNDHQPITEIVTLGGFYQKVDKQ